tara:strand:+ start:968 stop:1216 length:249 start_codon:yes stop_codon:yes gene_type:complete
MPRYQYRCTTCDKISVISHASSDVETDCPECGNKDTLVKMLTQFRTNKAGTEKKKVGQITERFIEDSRHELQQQRKKLDKDR